MDPEKDNWSRNWEIFLDSVNEKTKKRYCEVVGEFTMFCETNDSSTMLQKYIDYASKLHRNGLKTSSIWSLLSPVKKYVQLRWGVDNAALNTINPLLKNWGKRDATKKSSVFSLEQFNNYINNAPTTPQTITIKVCSILSMFGLLRNAEVISMNFNSLKRENTTYIGTVMRKKSQGPMAPTTFLIDGESNVAILDRYISLFNQENKVAVGGRLLRRISPNWVPYNSPVGYNTIAKYPEKIAEFLNLENPKEFTGHAFRRSSATALAGSGAPMLLLKNAGGWRSDTIAQGYVDSS